MKRFFSHLPAWVEASAAGIWRASANIMAMACSAVVIELPNGVFITITPRGGGGRDVDVVDADAGAADHLQLLGRGEQLGGDLGGRADGEAVVVADDPGELVLVEAGLDVDVDAALLEDRDGGGGELVGDENAGAWGKSCEWAADAPRRMECGTAPPRMPDDGIERGRRDPALPPSRGGGASDAAQAALASLAFSAAKAQSSQGVSASTSAVSTVAPHQMRRPGGASR